MAQIGAVFVFCSSCKILYFASSVHPKNATEELISYHLEKIHTVDRHHTTETIIFQGGYGWTMYGG